jgi:hypothetical protein
MNGRFAPEAAIDFTHVFFCSPHTVINPSEVVSHALFQLSISQKLVFGAP